MGHRPGDARFEAYPQGVRVLRQDDGGRPAEHHPTGGRGHLPQDELGCLLQELLVTCGVAGVEELDAVEAGGSAHLCQDPDDPEAGPVVVAEPLLERDGEGRGDRRGNGTVNEGKPQALGKPGTHDASSGSEGSRDGDDERTGLREGMVAPGGELASKMLGALHDDAGDGSAVAGGWRGTVQRAGRRQEHRLGRLFSNGSTELPATGGDSA